VTFRKLIPALGLLCTILVATKSAILQAEVEMTSSGDQSKTFTKQTTATITAIDYDTRAFTLEGPLGNTFTLIAGENVKRFDQFAKGDHVFASYTVSINGDIRTPTEDELKEPWVELDSAAIAEANMPPSVTIGSVVRAVCTVEGMDGATRSVTIKDSRGDSHVIEDVDPVRLAGVTLGQTVIITFSESLALTLEKVNPDQ
jgi:hypothetical protein